MQTTVEQWCILSTTLVSLVGICVGLVEHIKPMVIVGSFSLLLAGCTSRAPQDRGRRGSTTSGRNQAEEISTKIPDIKPIEFKEDLNTCLRKALAEHKTEDEGQRDPAPGSILGSQKHKEAKSPHPRDREKVEEGEKHQQAPEHYIISSPWQHALRWVRHRRDQTFKMHEQTSNNLHPTELTQYMDIEIQQGVPYTDPAPRTDGREKHNNVKTNKSSATSQSFVVDSCDTCRICLGEYQLGDSLGMIVGCHHCFHLECLQRWFDEHNQCPFCRYHENDEQYNT